MDPGVSIGRYVLLGKLASGGMAEVFLARQQGLEGFSKTVVVKKILPHLAEDPHFVQMFLNEARLAALINHPHVVSILELGRDDSTGSYFMAMEWIDGCNLRRLARAYVQRNQRMPTEVAVRVIVDACAGLDFAHNLKSPEGAPLELVHRDVSPENILLTYGGLVKVVDFGIAKALHIESHTGAGQVKGKFSFMPPEHLLGQRVDRRADVWALGVTLYWLLSGRKPFKADSEGELVQRILNDELPRFADHLHIPPELEGIVSRALIKKPEARISSARELQRDLESWLALEGKAVSNSALGDLMNDLFPANVDPQRRETYSLLTGEVQSQATPASGFTERAFLQTAVRTHTAVRHARRRRIALWTTGVGVAVLAAVGIALGTRHPAARPVAQVATAAPVAAPPSPPVSPRMVTPIPPALPAGLPAASPADRARDATSSESTTVAHRRSAARVGERLGQSQPGTLALRVLPFASVFLDGQAVGTTPMEPMQLSSGLHHLRLVNDEVGVTREMTVVIKPGETSLVKAKLK